MHNPLTVGIPFSYNDEWIGGVYYVTNLIGALSAIPPDRRPSIVVICDGADSLDFIKSRTSHPRARFISSADLRRAPGAERGNREAATVDVVLLGSLAGLEDRSIKWIPDFQEERFPELFPDAVLKWRRRNHAQCLAAHRHVMVSSNDVRADLHRYYGGYDNAVHVVRFASFIDEFHGADALPAKYQLPDRFFICSNQVFRHKNHGLVLKAMAACAAGGSVPTIVFTGKEHDYRDPQYAAGIKSLASDLGLGSRARFLGFLPRDDQLGLISQAIAVIQPSLCEGWSTVIEDAKALGRYVLASDIAVHREQIGENVEFFPPDDPQGLAELLRAYEGRDPQIAGNDYAGEKARFAQALLDMIEAAVRDYDARGVDRVVIAPPAAG